MTRVWQVVWSYRADKDLRALPEHIYLKFRAWVMAVEAAGMEEVRRLPGFHDEPLRGARKGQRSVRLNRSYRVIYVETVAGHVHVARVIEVHKHAY